MCVCATISWFQQRDNSDTGRFTNLGNFVSFFSNWKEFFFLPFFYSNPLFAINEYKLRTKKKWIFISIDIVVAIIYFKFLLVLQVRLKEIILKLLTIWCNNWNQLSIPTIDNSRIPKKRIVGLWNVLYIRHE